MAKVNIPLRCALSDGRTQDFTITVSDGSGSDLNYWYNRTINPDFAAACCLPLKLQDSKDSYQFSLEFHGQMVASGASVVEFCNNILKVTEQLGFNEAHPLNHFASSLSEPNFSVLSVQGSVGEIELLSEPNPSQAANEFSLYGPQGRQLGSFDSVEKVILALDHVDPMQRSVYRMWNGYEMVCADDPGIEGLLEAYAEQTSLHQTPKLSSQLPENDHFERRDVVAAIESEIDHSNVFQFS